MKIPVTNRGKNTLYVGAYAIPAGETRHFEENAVPLHLRPARPEAPAPAPVVDALAEIAGKTVKDITAAIPGLKDEDLTRLEALEKARTVKQGEKDVAAPRSGVLTALSAEMLSRADKKVEGKDGTAPAAGGEGGKTE